MVKHGERFNTLSHLFATAVAFIGAYVLLETAAEKSDMWKLACFAVYGLTTVGLYFISTIYHGSHGPAKKFFRKLDYIGIYLKIAGNYTPFAVLILRGTVGWVVLATVWALALFGIYQELFLWQERGRRISMMIYGIMSLSVLPFVKQLIDGLPAAGFALIVAGYLSYAVGVYFFLNDRRVKHGHGIWHICVICGTTCQFLCLFFYVA
jgi:hemolysin III